MRKEYRKRVHFTQTEPNRNLEEKNLKKIIECFEKNFLPLAFEKPEANVVQVEKSIQLKLNWLLLFFKADDYHLTILTQSLFRTVWPV